MSPSKFTSNLICFIGLIASLSGCKDKPVVTEIPLEAADPLFSLLTPAYTGIEFNNNLTEAANTNVMMYEYFYNGGGVAIGDVNGDGLQDIYFTGNMTSNRLYLNKGNMQFEDITLSSGVGGREGPWATGSSMADVNGDGLMDIYVCYSGKLPSEKRANQLFINDGMDENGIPRFREQAAQYGLASTATSTQAFFFDFDRDGDLDLFLLNHSPDPLPVLDEFSTGELLKQVDERNGVRLFRNEKGFFNDVTEESGIQSSALSYGLGAGISDINGDGWPDIYISNDYAVPDFLYINNADGTFTDQLKSSFGHISHFSMGNDVSDINNDGFPDIFTLDMLPEDNRRQKLLFAPDNYEKFNLNLRVGFHYQYMRNMLHINNGNGTFSEIAQLSGISNTDWSWAPLFADFDNDGWKDLYVTNGYLRDYTNMDFIKYMDDFVKEKGGRMKREDVLELVHQMPASNVSNYMYKNNGGITFSNIGHVWGIDLPSNSNGAAYVDLDNDGDLDLVINNINKPAFIFQNHSEKILQNNYLQVKLEGSAQNTAGLGAKLSVFTQGKQQFLEQMPIRGYQSSVSPILHFGLGKEQIIDSLHIIWQSGKSQLVYNVEVNQLIEIKENQVVPTIATAFSEQKPAIFEETKSPISYKHEKSNFNDFKRQPLMVNPISDSGPVLTKADVNSDGLEDVYLGGGKGQGGILYLQQRGGSFLAQNISAFEKDKESVDTDAHFFDANGDGFLDLYVTSGGYDDFILNDTLLQDRLYFNDGKGDFIKKADALPGMYTSNSCIKSADINDDGFPDLFVGGRVIPGRYPEIPQSFILINDTKGNFSDMTVQVAPEIQSIGMVTDAAWVDLNNTGRKELVIVGEWMPATVFSNTNGKLINATHVFFKEKYLGWWNKILVDDFNGDGMPDLVIGNFGLNSQVKADIDEPSNLYFKDFDDNGSVDPILSFYIQGKAYPYVTRDELLDQISMMRSRFPDYKSYADASLTDIFTKEELKDVSTLEANFLKTAYFENTSSGQFLEKTLPIEVQFSPVYSILTFDYNRDGNKDLLLCGNINQARLRFGNYDANYGILLRGDGKGNFMYVPQYESGLRISGDVRSIIEIGDMLLFGINQHGVKAYKTQVQPVNKVQ